MRTVLKSARRRALQFIEIESECLERVPSVAMSATTLQLLSK